ncbi:MAG: hypothetical protein WCX73_02340 [Candidatus Pacearchaeota archaeon]|jgi:uncharacterized protein YuzE
MLKRKNKNTYIKKIVIICAILIIILVGYFYFKNTSVIETQKIYTEAILGERPGFDLNSTALTFGKVVLGNSASREVFITNDFDKDVIIEISSKGEISDFLIVSDNEFILAPNEKKTISFSVLFPKGSEMKKYTGWIEVKTKNA